MEIIMRSIAELKKYDGNARTHNAQQVQELIDSIKTYGFLDPIEIAKDLTIIAGHARIAAALELGLTRVPTICHSHLNKTLQRGYTLAANRIAQSAGWDGKLLKEEFLGLREDGFDLRLTGFHEDEIVGYLEEDNLEEDNIDDRNGESRGTIAQSGDTWLLGDHRLYVGYSSVPECDMLIKEWQKSTGKIAVREEMGD